MQSNTTEKAKTAPPRHVFKMQITDIIDHTADIRELIIANRDNYTFRFRAGQFVMLQVPPQQQESTQASAQASAQLAEPKKAKPIQRAYSIASDERIEDSFRLIFKKVPGGMASTYVWALQKEAEIAVTGPFGRLFFQEPPPEQVLFLNTGSGVSQHMSFLASRGEFFSQTRFHMLFGLRREQDIYYKKELDELKARLPHFDYSFVLSRASDSWQGRRGYVQDFLLNEYDVLNIPTTIYLCGNRAMIDSVHKLLVEENSFDKKKILAEAFD